MNEKKAILNFKRQTQVKDIYKILANITMIIKTDMAHINL